MNDITQSIQSCLDSKNWYGALIITLMLPDICSALEFGSTNASRYTNWFETYKDSSYVKHMAGSDCYALRCSILHEGILDVQHQSIQIKQKESKPSAIVIDKFSFATGGSHLLSFRNVKAGSEDDGRNLCHLDVKIFCLDMINSLNKWSLVVDSVPEIQQRIGQSLKIESGATIFGGAVKIDS